MPTSYQIDHEAGVVFSTASGTLTDEDIIAHRNALNSDSSFDPSYNQLADFLGVERNDATTAGIRIAAIRIPFSEGSKRAFVFGKDSIYGLARMYQTLTEDHDHDVTLFRDIDEACAWLGIPPIAKSKGG